jgi:hypothetical protein
MPEGAEQRGPEREQVSNAHDGAGRSFATLYSPLAKEVFHRLVGEAVADGSDPDERAREYAELGKPDFALAYLLAGKLADEQRREVLARAYERRAETTEVRAREFDSRFHRPFPMLFTEATNDRAIARKVRAGRPVLPGAGRALPQM